MRKKHKKAPHARTYADDCAAARKLVNEVFRAVLGPQPPLPPTAANGTTPGVRKS